MSHRIDQNKTTPKRPRMFRLVLVLILLGIMPQTLQILDAQTALPHRFYELGVHGGVVSSSMVFSPTTSSMDNLQNGYVGLSYRTQKDKYVGLQVELNVVNRGWEESPETYTYSRTMTYLELPFLTHLTFELKRLRWYINAGPSLALMLHESSTFSALTPDAERETQHILAVYNKLDYSILGSTGIEWSMGKVLGHVEARYNFGFGDIFSNNPSDFFHVSRSQYIALSVGLTYQWFNVK